jgi:pimeloyl-ACP methyl ester carboxylesterase
VKKILVACAAGILVTALGAAEPALASSHGRAAAARPAAARVAAASSITWGKCPTKAYPDLKGTKVKCTTLKVPLDYDNPDNGKTVSLAVSLLKHTSSAKNYKGVMLSNPGGPGGSSLDLSIYLQPYVPHGVGKDYDWVTWDPRGIGSSTPTLRCDSNYFKGPRKDYDPTSKTILNYWLKRSKKYAEACESKHPALLQNDTTIDSAKDMDQIRKALGVDKVSYYGFSYGTYLGQVFSTLYPDNLSRMVLDSNVDPRRVWYNANLDQDKAFQRNVKIYFTWIAKYNSVFHLGTTEKAVNHRYWHDYHRLNKNPIGVLGGDEFSDAIVGAPYYRSTWVDLANAWKKLDIDGSSTAIKKQYEDSDTPGDDNEFAGYNAVQCADVQWPTSWAKWKKDAVAYNKKYPFLTWDNVWYNAPCLNWGAKAGTPETIDGSKTPSVLLIDEELDAATPFEGSLEVRKLYPHASLLAEPGGTTHADSLDGDACVDDTIATYLKTGKLPARKSGNRPDKLCKPLPKPVPSGASHARTAHTRGATSARLPLSVQRRLFPVF